MLPIVKLLARVSIASILSVCPVVADTFVENDGILIMEAESSAAQGDWGLERSVDGFSGNGYLRWNGSDSFAVSTAGRGAITYRFRIKRAGNYELLWRSRITRGNNRTEHNDSWARFPTGQNIRGEQGLNGWTKVYMSTLNKWAWQSATVDNVGRRVRQYFSAGEHTFQISGRSNGHAIDRIALFDYSDNRISPSRFDSLPQSGTTGNSSPSNPPVPTPEPIPEPPTNPLPITVNAPLVAVAGNILSWPAVTAIVINVHRGTGEWLESLPASQTQWQAPAAGQYYLVATGEGSWESWGRSETVTVETSPTSSDGAASMQLSAQVYSSTALELFWMNTTAVDLSYEIRRDDQLLSITDGRSYFDDAVEAGMQYEYTLVGTDASGDVVTTSSVSVSTNGNSANNDQTTSGGLGLTGQTYSQSAIELFWNTNQLESNSAYQFEIYLNAELVETTNGRSFFVDNLSADTEYQFFVITLGSDGSALATESTVVRTLAPDFR